MAASDALNKWLAHYDPIHRGWSPRGIANGVCATNGFAFPRVAGGYNLYRVTADAADLDSAALVGAAGANATWIDTFAWTPATPLQEYLFALRSIGGGGIESLPCASKVKVTFDAAGYAADLRPNAPTSLAVVPRTAGRFVVSWRYVERGEETAPLEFHVYSGPGGGAVDFDNPIGVVAYRVRGGRFHFVTETHPHGAERSFAVRAVSASGATDGNSIMVRSRADAVGPPHTPVFVEIINGD